MVAMRLMTVDDLDAMPMEARSVELFDGVPREHPGVSVRHGYLGVRILGPLYVHLTTHAPGGELFISDTQFVLERNPDTVVKPDVAFIRAERMPPPEDHDRISRIPPDLAVEIVSPGDRPAEIADKVRRYQAAGIPLLWYVDPFARSVTVYALGAAPVVLRIGDVLDGGAVLPGFTLAVADIFAEPDYLVN